MYRITNKYGAKPSAKINLTLKDTASNKKLFKENSTSKANKTFRFGMGFNDGSDRLISRLGLTGKNYEDWQPWVSICIYDIYTFLYISYIQKCVYIYFSLYTAIYTVYIHCI